MLRAYKYRIYPTKEQKILLAKHFGCVRFVYNRALELKNKAHQETQTNLSRFEIQSEIPKWKKDDAIWLKEVNAQSIQSSLLHLDIAFTNFFKKQADHPVLKSRRNHQSFSCPQHCKVNFEQSKFYCPKFREGIKTTFSRKFDGQIRTCTISKTPTNKYFVSILVKTNEAELEKLPLDLDKCLGIDLGIKDFATLSTGEKISNERFLNKKLKKLKRLNRQHSKKKKGSKNREKSRIKLAIQHEKVTNYRKDFQHKLSHRIAENQGYTSVAMETLNIKGMIKNHKLARHIQDAAWFQFKTFLKYKLEQRGKTLLEIPTFAPSSKMCTCGHINQLTLKDRIWTCESCGETHDRDILAANNIKRFAFIGVGNAEFTSLEIRNSESMKEECSN